MRKPIMELTQTNEGVYFDLKTRFLSFSSSLIKRNYGY